MIPLVNAGGSMGALGFLLSLLGVVFFAVLLASALLTSNLTAIVLAALGLALAFPVPGGSVLAGLGNWGAALRVAGSVALVLATAYALLAHRPPSIYASDAVRARFHALYDEKMREWPLPFEDRFLETDLGTVHVVVSGPEDASPMLLLHASGVGSWSWRANAGALGQTYRLFAIDLIGDAGKSEYADLSNVMRSGADQAALYETIMDRLGIPGPAVVVGASEGGFVASNLAVHRPDRVERLILLGPMGYAGATGAVLRIMGAQLFPIGPVQDATFRWAFSDAPNVIAEFNLWFRLLMSETYPAKVAPLPLRPEDRRSIEAPTLFIFGTRDNLVGDPEVARARVADMQDVTVEVVEAGHLMGVERPSEINRLILAFLESRAGPG
jgi:pimeloyl-ACP methyl ester carboxylesterase